MRFLSFALAGLLVGLALACPASAQVQPPSGTAEGAAEAIAKYEALRKDPAKRAVATRQLLWLGEIRHVLVTDYLSELLAETGACAASVTVLQAIARASRPSLEGQVWQVLTNEKASFTVQQAAASALFAMGGGPSERLLEMLERGEKVSGTMKQAVARAAIGRKDARAIRGLVGLFDEGKKPEELQLLRLFDPIRGVPEVSALRGRLVESGSEVVAAVAWRQLVEEEDPRARKLIDELLDRFDRGPTAAAAVELIPGLARMRDEDLYPLLLRCGGLKGRGIKQALRKAAEYAAQDRALLSYLVRNGLDDDRPSVREVAVALLQRAPADVVLPVVERVRKALRRPRRKTLDLAVGLHPLLVKDPTWEDDLLRLAESSIAEVRTVGLTLLLDIGSDKGITCAQRSLNDKFWSLRVAAIRYLTRFRAVESIPLLIGRVGKEEGRVAAELSNALFVHTGTRYFGRSEWTSWWRRNKDGFELPHEKTVAGGGVTSGGQTTAYHGIPVVSNRVAFLIDTSGSMAAQVGTDKKLTRLKLAKSELLRVLEAIPADFRINLISYHSGVEALWERLRPASNKNRGEVREDVAEMRPAGGTNIYGALEKAFEDPEIDTIYLLTDGQPTAGDIVDPAAIADEVRRWNRLRQIVIHGIGLGIDSPLLKRLAEESGGVYKYVR